MPPATRRSWYLSADIAEKLNAAAKDLHYELRVSKAAALNAIIETGLAHISEARDRLTAADGSRTPARPATMRTGKKGGAAPPRHG